MPLTQFAVPGSADHLTSQQQTAWSARVDKTLKSARNAVAIGADKAQFFDPIGVALDADAQTPSLRWKAFPRKQALKPIPARWQQAELRDNQEEYCEWVATRENGKITSVAFTSETPEYYVFLAVEAPEVLVGLYQTFVDPSVTLKDLKNPDGSYNTANAFNLTGAMHMVQGSNTLGAAVTLVAEASVTRTRNGHILTNAAELIACGVHADAERNSDPLITASVNELARRGAAVSLRDPLGLYIDGFEPDAQWKTPDGSNPADYWKPLRGDADHVVRAEFRVPEDKGFSVGDIQIGGHPITSPSQIADAVFVRVDAVAHQFGQHELAPRACGT